MPKKFFLAAMIVAGCGTLALAADRIWLDAKVNNQPVRFILDTGAGPAFLLRSQTAKRLGIRAVQPPRGEPVPAGMVALAYSEPVTLAIDGITYRTRLNVEADRASTADFDDDGAVGWTALTDRIAEIDASNLTMKFLPAPPSGPEWSKWKIADAGVLVFETGEGDNKARIFVDTGDFRGVGLNMGRWVDWRQSHERRFATMVAGSTPAIKRNVIGEMYRARKIKLGGLEFHDVPVTALDARLNNTLSCDASLGLYALREFDFVIDRKDGFVYTRPIEAPPKQFQYNRFGGMIFMDPGSGRLFTMVFSGGTAHKAGIRDYDIVTKIDGVEVKKWVSDTEKGSITQLLSQPPGTEIRLTLKRDKKELEVAVKLEDPVPCD